jgi:hypothetical protein
MFILNPSRFASSGGGGGLSAAIVSKLIAVYKFNDGALGTDELGNHNLTQQGAVTTDSGVSGDAADFTGDGALGKRSTGLYPNGIASVSFWIKYDAPSSYTAGWAYPFCFDAGFRGPLTILDDASSVVLRFETDIPFATTDYGGGWHHVVISYTVGVELLGWYDGVKVVDTVSSQTLSDPAIQISTRDINSASKGPMPGWIDEVYVSDEVFTDADAAELWNSGVGNFYS